MTDPDTVDAIEDFKQLSREEFEAQVDALKAMMRAKDAQYEQWLQCIRDCKKAGGGADSCTTSCTTIVYKKMWDVFAPSG